MQLTRKTITLLFLHHLQMACELGQARGAFTHQFLQSDALFGEQQALCFSGRIQFLRLPQIKMKRQ